MSESPQPKRRRPPRRAASRTTERPVDRPNDRAAPRPDLILPPRVENAREPTIVLVGLMGVGKTTIGRRLAARLRLGFVDTDREIERASGMSIPEIFARFGEAHFRDGERRVIRRLLQGRRVVLATGGGAFMDEETRALILARATAVWLDADLDVLAERVSRRQGTRPLLTGADPRTVLGELAAVRNPIYALAPVHVRSEPLPHEATVTAILKAMRR
ncbi:shikimate kinase [Sphingomonas prati]|uniref:Shikimate kinase n=1 Tax=Sphingomonas prati TaxID=1843237 RepID=A0A7W9F1Q5_9SPHN|nr:shikimate kinase [Sphingomonas prati]MBB5729511.1 shikimate kinase [Sphingomonas prati]